MQRSPLQLFSTALRNSVWRKSGMTASARFSRYSKQPFFVLAEFEIIIFFFAKLDLPPFRPEFAVGAAFLIGQELFLANGVITGLFVLVDLSFVEKPLQNSLHDFLVAIPGRLRPVVVLHIQFFPEIEKLLRNLFDEFGWSELLLSPPIAGLSVRVDRHR